ncbi:iron-sulfur cluster assembly scaffold protein [uncultured Methanomethylovorans sp.]|uniref:iron-sulfur cluster assembly scaffold protein n=1 Tax=uncultured Methanomethylovorans sp. TaxID=183759 RepID=UPI002AA732AE|nr:iron-sulfur cluster assembly scaffold protein [uncultured Methanomethylovorans sp.]
MYSRKLLEEFTNPKNVGVIEGADGVGQLGNPAHGDVITIYIKVKDGVLDDVKFKTFGCAAAIATSSMVTQMAKGRTIKEAMCLTKEEVADALGGLPPGKMDCSNFAPDTLKVAIEDYQKKHKV